MLSLDKGTYSTNEKCRLTVGLNTKDLKKNLHKIFIHLIAQVSLRDYEGHFHYSEFQVHNWSYPGLVKGELDSRTYDL